MDERIEQIQQAITRMAQGDFQVNVAVEPADEIGRLGQAVQACAASLLERQQALEKDRERLRAELTVKTRQLHDQETRLSRLANTAEFFRSVLSHDLRNPIGNIQLMSEVMLGDAIGPSNEAETRGFVKDIHEQARIMSNWLAELLTIAEIETGRLRLNISEVDVPGFLGDLARYFARTQAAQLRRIELLECPAGRAAADPQRLLQIFDILTANALAASPAGGKVQLRALRLESGWRFEVQDHGRALSEQVRQVLFLDQNMAAARSAGSSRSVGLGLSIVRRLVELQGGKAGAAAGEAAGTVLWFTLPARA